MEVSGNKPNQQLYHQEVVRGANLFEASFKNYQHSNLDAQKTQYQKVMSECLQVIQDAASGLMNKQLLEMKAKLEKDYSAYLNNPSQTNQTNVEKDLKEIKKL